MKTKNLYIMAILLAAGLMLASDAFAFGDGTRHIHKNGRGHDNHRGNGYGHHKPSGAPEPQMLHLLGLGAGLGSLYYFRRRKQQASF